MSLNVKGFLSNTSSALSVVKSCLYKLEPKSEYKGILNIATHPLFLKLHSSNNLYKIILPYLKCFFGLPFLFFCAKYFEY
jgi:hypothetical protein